MIIRIVFKSTLFFVLITGNVFSQQKAEYNSRKYISSLEKEERVSKVKRAIEVHYNDEREYQTKKISFSKFKESLVKALEEKGFDAKSGTDVSGIAPLQIKVETNYLGLYETDGGSWGHRAILNLHSSDPQRPDYRATHTVSVDEVLSSDSPEHHQQRQLWKSSLIEKAVSDVVLKISEFANRHGERYREVIVHGKAALTDSTGSSLKSVKKQAILNALRRGVERAWGISLESTTTMVDLGEVTEQTQTRRAGNIMEYSVIEPYTRETVDGKIVVLVRAIVTDPS
jgi:hypothetical protein